MDCPFKLDPEKSHASLGYDTVVFGPLTKDCGAEAGSRREQGELSGYMYIYMPSLTATLGDRFVPLQKGLRVNPG